MYTINMIGTVDGGATNLSFAGNSFTFTGGNDPWAKFIDTTVANNDLLLTPLLNELSGGSMNTNAVSGGVSGSNSVGSGEAMRLDFVHDLAGDTAKTSGSVNDYALATNEDQTFSGHYTVNGASAAFTNISGGTAQSTVKIIAFDDSDGNYVVGDGALDSISAVAITYLGETKFISLASIGSFPASVTVGGHSFTISEDNSSGHTEVLVGSVVSDTQIATFTVDGYNSIEYHWAGGQDFKIGNFGTAAINPGQPVNLTLPLTVTDGDGDTASGMIDATLLPPSPSTLDFSASATGVTETVTATAPNILGSSYDDILNGEAHANTLAGGAGNDTLIGGGGSDILIGGTGNDKFVYNAITDGLDIIKDFSAGDELDFSHTAFGNLAIGGGNTTLDSAHFETVNTGNPVQGTKAGSEFVFNTNDHTLYYDGAGGSYAIAMAKLENGHTLTNSEIHIV
jgi:Ca2+-binding RTX toxin-like protein